MENITLIVAFLAGLLSFLSPCVLPLVPAYISFISGMSLEEIEDTSKKKFLTRSGLSSIYFVLGFSLVFVLLGASATFVGKLLAEYLTVLSKVAGIIIVVFGLHLVGLLRIKWINYEKKFQVKKSSPSFLSAFIIGIAFAFGWTPCIGPILAGILAIAATKDTMFKGILLLSVYSVGLGIPFIITGFAVSLFMRFFKKYRRFIRWGEIVAGIFLIFIGGLMLFSDMGFFMKFIPPAFYEFSK